MARLMIALLAAQPADAPAAPPPPVVQLPPQLTDPATGDKLANVMQALSRAFLNLPVGERPGRGRRPAADPGRQGT